jgi:predicted transcriptional regulator of viral defense system
MRPAKSRSPYTGIGGISGSNRHHLELLHREFRDPFGAEEAARLLGLPHDRTSRLLRHLAERGWLTRVRQGLYITVPLEARSSGEWIEDPWVVGSKAFAPCYIAGWSACEHWGLTEQIFNEIALVSSKPIRRSSQSIQGTNFRVKAVAPDQIFGTRTVWRNQSQVEVSDPSRTVIDMLDDPSFGGGIRHVAHALTAYFEEHLDRDALLEYAERRGNRSVYKRLGYLIESRKLPSDGLLEPCRERMSTGVVDLDPASPKGGPIVKRWNLRVNVDVVENEM